MIFFRGRVFLAAILLALVRLNAFAATDPEIDRLLKKLPPPDKVVHADDRILRINDPALRDPLVKQIDAANKARQTKRALELAQQLVRRYPSSVAANCYAGYFASELKRYGEASICFRHALVIQPRFVLAHYCLGVVEWRQGHANLALQHLREATKLEPRAAPGWAMLSLCAQMAGARDESVRAAKRLVELVPGQVAAWVRLAMAEKSAGNYHDAVQAMNRAIAVQRSTKASNTHKSSSPKKKAAGRDRS